MTVSVCSDTVQCAQKRYLLPEKLPLLEDLKAFSAILDPHEIRRRLDVLENMPDKTNIELYLLFEKLALYSWYIVLFTVISKVESCINASALQYNDTTV